MTNCGSIRITRKALETELMAETIYDTIIENIDAESGAWCQGSWERSSNGASIKKGDKISRCLVGHVDLATGVAYTRENGRFHRSVDPHKWYRRNQVLRHLFEAMTPKMRERLDSSYQPGSPDVTTLCDVEDEKNLVVNFLAAVKSNTREEFKPYRVSTRAEGAVINFNDNAKTRKRDVKTLLQRAAKRFPED